MAVQSISYITITASIIVSINALKNINVPHNWSFGSKYEKRSQNIKWKNIKYFPEKSLFSFADLV
jgi:hypothetical protein